MGPSHRKSYLKNLIKFAGVEESSYGVAPFDKRNTNLLIVSGIKSVLRAAKKTRKGNSSIYKNLTCASLIPKVVIKLTLLERAHA